MIFLWVNKRRRLSKIASAINFSLTRNEFELSSRYKGLENLLFYKPDLIAKEIMFNFYFPVDQLFVSIEKSIREVLGFHLGYMITGKGRSWLKNDGHLARNARKIILKPLGYLPPPFYRRVRERLRYLSADMRLLQDDKNRLELIARSLFDKGCIISDQTIPYYKTITFKNLFTIYLERRFTENFVQAVLVDMNILKLSYKGDSTQLEYRPISQEKKSALLRKELFVHMNDFAQRLANDKKQDFIQEIVGRGIDGRTGRRAIEDLAELLHRYPYNEAKEKVLQLSYIVEFTDRILSDKYEIGPEGIHPRGL